MARSARTVAFLRAINVGGHTVKMAELRTLFEALGLERVETFIASGNVIFEGGPREEGALRRKIEAHLRTSLGYEVHTFLRGAAEVVAIAAHEAFSEAERASAGSLNVAFLEAPLDEAGRRALEGLASDDDAFHVHGREIYWRCRTQQHESAISNAVLEKALGQRLTLRGFGTLAKLAAKLVPA